MARSRPPDRFTTLVRTATDVFVRAGGVQRAQMDDVARAMDVAKGTLYLYVASKEALFDLALRYADDDAPQPDALPVPTPSAAATLDFVRSLTAAESAFPSLAADAPALDVLSELYDGLARNRRRLKLVSVSAVDWPELGAIWFGGTRRPLLDRLERWIRTGVQRHTFHPDLHPAATARLVAETATWFAVHRHFDPAPDPLPDDVARETTISALRRVLERP